MGQYITKHYFIYLRTLPTRILNKLYTRPFLREVRVSILYFFSCSVIDIILHDCYYYKSKTVRDGIVCF